MVKISFANTESKHLDSLFYHLSVQSLLDIKAVNGEVNIGILRNLLNSSYKAKTVFFDGKIAYIVFIIPTDVEECSIFVLSSTLGYTNNDALQQSFKSIINDLPNGTFYSIVYKGNHKYTSLLKQCGFVFEKTIIHGEEKRNFILLGLNKNG